MKVTMMSYSKKKALAMLVIQHGTGSSKRSETRFCVGVEPNRAAAGDRWKGYILDRDRKALNQMSSISQELVRRLAGFGIEEKSYVVEDDSLFVWLLSADNTSAYYKHVMQARRKAQRIVAILKGKLEEQQRRENARKLELAELAQKRRKACVNLVALPKYLEETSPIMREIVAKASKDTGNG